MMRYVYLLILIVFPSLTLAAVTGPVTPDPQVEVLKARLEAQQREFDLQREQLEARMQEQLAATNKRFDDAAVSMSKLFWILGIFGGVGSLFAFATWFTGRADYLSQRKGQDLLVQQQVQVGEKLMLRSQELVDHEIESMANLRKVIGLVADSFEFQVKREKGLEEFTALVADLSEHFKASYARARDGILSLKVSRMGWATLPITQHRIAARARAEFQAIPGRYLRREEEAAPFEFAMVCQRIGTSAFYANDIDYAHSLLTRSWDAYRRLVDEKGSCTDDHLNARLSDAFFLGLIAKSWIGDNQSIEAALGEAKNRLKEAGDLLQNRADKGKTEFQVPVTYAEVLSYMEAHRAEARDLLGEPKATRKQASGSETLIARLEAMPSLDANQRQLLGRACLIRGNLEVIMGRKATIYYEQAQEHDPKNAYSTLSLALDTPESEGRKHLFEKGLDGLKEKLEKQEVTTLALALAWATIASHELGLADRNKHLEHIENILASGEVNAEGRQPLFFNPRSKTLCRLTDLLETLREYIGTQHEAPGLSPTA
jgi:hypothetical protein